MQLFSPWADSLLRGGVACVVLGVGGGFAALFAGERSPFITQANEAPMQPVKFDHRHHVGDDAIPCLYCHDGATKGRFAGVPDVATCMGCHNQIWTNSPELAPVRAAAADNRPIVWQRVTNLPDHVFFNHGVHVTHGVACAHCHGDVGAMGQVHPTEPLTMKFCVDCHKERGATIDCSSCHR